MQVPSFNRVTMGAVLHGCAAKGCTPPPSKPSTTGAPNPHLVRQTGAVSARPARVHPKGRPVNLVAYAALAFVPAAFFCGLAKALDWWVRGATRDRVSKSPAPAGPPIERLVADLRRLERDYSRIERSDLPRRAVRLQGVSLAYDDTLCACATALEIPWSPRPPLDGVQRLQIEAALAQHGLVW